MALRAREAGSVEIERRAIEALIHIEEMDHMEVASPMLPDRTELLRSADACTAESHERLVCSRDVLTATRAAIQTSNLAVAQSCDRLTAAMGYLSRG